MGIKFSGCVALSLLIPFSVNMAKGELLTFEAAHQFSSSVVDSGGNPVGTVSIVAAASPWLTATFDHQGTDNFVTVTLSSTGLPSFVDGAPNPHEGNTESVAEWYLNVTPSILSGLSISNIALVSGEFDVAKVSINIAEDGYTADGDGQYDIKVDFGNTAGKASKRFTQGDAMSFRINGVTDVTAFDCLSTPHGGFGPFTTAAHVLLGTDSAGSSYSVWVSSVPEPSSLTLALLGLAIIALRVATKPR